MGNDPSVFWMIAIAAVAMYCIAQALRDLRGKHYGWAVAAFIAAGLMLCLPIKTHAVKIDLPTHQ